MTNYVSSGTLNDTQPTTEKNSDVAAGTPSLGNVSDIRKVFTVAKVCQPFITFYTEFFLE